MLFPATPGRVRISRDSSSVSAPVAALMPARVSQASKRPPSSTAILPASLFDFGQRMRCENQRRPVDADNILEQESPELGGRQRIQAARRFIEQQHRRPVKHGARQAQPVNVSRRKRAHLAVEQLAEAERAGEFRNPPRRLGVGKIVEAGKQHEVFSRAQARVKAGSPPPV